MNEPTRNDQASKPQNLDDAIKSIVEIRHETRTRLGKTRAALIEVTKEKALLDVSLEAEERYLEELETLLTRLKKVKETFYNE